MCIAIYVPTGKNIKDEQIRNAFSNNRDGAGVMHYDKYGRVQYSKGFMNVESLLAYWHNNTTDKYPRAIHCRIATSGKISKGCCHPFPITDDLDVMLKSHGKSKTGCLIHNGVFNIATKTGCPIVIITMRDTLKIHKNFPFKRTRVEMRCVQVLYKEDYASMNSAELSDHVHKITLDDLQ